MVGTASASWPGLTCGEVATRVRDRLLALVHGVRLHLIGPARCQFLCGQLQCVVAVKQEAAIVLAVHRISETKDLDLEAGVMSRPRWLPCD